MTEEETYQLQHGRLSPALLERIGIDLIRELAAIVDCDEDSAECDWDSGPICRTHGTVYHYIDLIKRARLFLLASGAGQP